MLVQAVQSYLASRRAAGFALTNEGQRLNRFAAYSETRGKDYVCSATAIEWAGLAQSLLERARRLGDVIRFVRYARAEDDRHELPSPIFGSENRPRPVPFIFSREELRQMLQSVAQPGRPYSLCRETYRTLFALMACTGLRVSEAIALRYEDITSDGLIIRRSKFRKARLVPLHSTARAALDRYLERRRRHAPFDDHVFVSARKKALTRRSVDTAFHNIVLKVGLPHQKGRPRATVHSLRHYFAVNALESCPDGRDRISRHMLALSTAMGHSKVRHTYWYLEATPYLMRDIADRCRHFVTGESTS
jgi:integrase/recombinase XerD